MKKWKRKYLTAVSLKDSSAKDSKLQKVSNSNMIKTLSNRNEV